MSRTKTISRYICGGLYALLGVNHFVNSALYVSVMPPYLPWHLALVYLSGIAEIVLGTLLLVRRWSTVAAWGLIPLLIAIFPANLHMAMHAELYSPLPPIVLWLRLPFQAVLIAWAYWYTWD